MSGPLDGVRLVALDLDGTLLPSDKRLTPRALRVVSDLRDAGIAVTLATGRGWTSAEQYARELRLAHPLVTFEGALVALPSHATVAGSGRETIHEATLHADVIRRVVHAIEDLHLGFFVCTAAERTVASRRVLAERRDQVAIWDERVHFVDAWREAETHGYILHLVGPPAEVREADRRLEALALPGVEYFRAAFWDGYDQIQVRPHGIGKHEGLRRILARMDLGPEHLLAAGDWLNDISMLRFARVSVTPSNGAPEVREIATHVLGGTSDDDAVIRFLEDALATL